MAARDYSLITAWAADGSVDDLAGMFGDIPGFVRWFPSVVLDARVVHAGAADGSGTVAVLKVKGWMPHTLTFRLRVIGIDAPHRLRVEVSGDFEGSLDCTAVPSGSQVMIYFHWRVRVNKPLVRYWSWLLRPLFITNHLWVVARGQESFNLELQRRRLGASTTSERPPAPTFPHGPLSTYATHPAWSLASRLDRVPEQG